MFKSISSKIRSKKIFLAKKSLVEEESEAIIKNSLESIYKTKGPGSFITKVFYNPENKTITIETSSKIFASDIFLNIGKLLEALRANKIPVEKIVVR